jgi:hypothetical protein
MYGSFNGKSKARTSYGWLIRNVNQKDFTQDLGLNHPFYPLNKTRFMTGPRKLRSVEGSC